MPVVEIKSDIDRRYREGKIGTEEYAKLKKAEIAAKVRDGLRGAAERLSDNGARA